MNLTGSRPPFPQAPAIAFQTQSTTSIPRSNRQRFAASRNFLVFPVQLGQQKSAAESFPFTTYTTIDLKTRHSYDPNLSQEADEIWIDTASYYKQKQNPQHEFIIFSVTTSNGMQNFIALERNVYLQGSSTLLGRNKFVPAAQDYFHISHYGEPESLAGHCGRVTPKNQSVHLERVDFEGQSFSFAQLVVLASTISEWEPGYRHNKNDRWFASLVWECIFGLFGGGIIRHNKHAFERGRLTRFKMGIHQVNLEQVMQRYMNDIAEFENGLKDDIDVISVDTWRERKLPIPQNDRPGTERSQVSDTLAPPEETHGPPKATHPIRASINSVRSRFSEKDRKLERGTISSTCASSNWTAASSSIDLPLTTRINKELPGLPPASPSHQLSRPRAKSVGSARRTHNTAREDSRAEVATLPEILVTSAASHDEHSFSRPPHAPREFSWIEVSPHGHFGMTQTNNKRYQFNTAHNPLPTRNSARIAQGHKPRSRSTYSERSLKPSVGYAAA